MKLLFVTGSRADYSKLRPLIERVAPEHDVHVFVTGQHVEAAYGLTWMEVCRLKGVTSYVQSIETESHPRVVSRTIDELSRRVPHGIDAIVVHGDRAEALAGAIWGALSNVHVVHVEGGELSGTVDESMRHAITKLSHLHFVSNDEAAARLRVMGESHQSIVVSGSPEVDVMMSSDLPSLDEVRERYSIPFTDYGICIVHPVPTEPDSYDQALRVSSAVLASGQRWVVIQPNNDPGSSDVAGAMIALRDHGHVVLPSMRHTHFITLLKHAQVVLGNSSCGVREAPVFGVPVVNVGSRQSGRVRSLNVLTVDAEYGALQRAIAEQWGRCFTPSFPYGRGGAAEAFADGLRRLDDIEMQKVWAA